VADFEAFLKRVKSLHRSRAYDCMRIAGGRTTDEQLREEARERKRKSRAKKIPKPEPISVTEPHVTESSNAEQGRVENARLDCGEEPERSAEQEQSAHCRDLFIDACRAYLPQVSEEHDWIECIEAWTKAVEDCKQRFGKKRKAA
jgi:hypothetical protein